MPRVLHDLPETRRDGWKRVALFGALLLLLGSGCTRCAGKPPIPRSPDMGTRITDAWERILRWHAKNGVQAFQLAPGATEQQISDAERELGLSLPEDLRISWSLHNGGLTDSAWILTHGELLPLERMVSQWKMYRKWQAEEGFGLGENFAPKDIRGPIKPVFWNPKRLALTDNSGDSLTIDLDPPAEGSYGQVIDFEHELGPTVVLAKSWTEFLEQFADDLEAGKYVAFPKEQMVALPGTY